MFGPPARGPMSFPKKCIDAVEYDAEDCGDCYVISISYGSDGVVREVMRLRKGGIWPPWAQAGCRMWMTRLAMNSLVFAP